MNKKEDLTEKSIKNEDNSEAPLTSQEYEQLELDSLDLEDNEESEENKTSQDHEKLLDQKLNNLIDNTEEESIDFVKWQAAIEALVFASDKPITLKKLHYCLNHQNKNEEDEKKENKEQEFETEITEEIISLENIKKVIDQIKSKFETQGFGLFLFEANGTFQFRTKAENAQYIQNLFRPSFLNLGATALEVLAIIAYRQPISKSEIDKTRGVDSSHIVRNLLKRKLVQISGRSHDAGRPTIYSTTNHFLEVFNLESLEDLPPEYELELLSKKDEQEDNFQISELFKETHEKEDNEIAELTEIIEQLKEIKSDTHFTKELRRNIELKKSQLEKKNQEAQDAKSAAPTSFEVLENFILKDSIARQNTLASESNYSNLLENF